MRKPLTRHAFWLGGAVLLALAAPAVAHEKAVLATENPRVPAGGVLALSGREFSKGVTYELKLAGAVREYALLEVRADSSGTFVLEVPVPVDVAAGAYKILAIAPDGDVVARLDVEVLGAPAASAAVSELEVSPEEARPEARETPSPMARAGEMEIEHHRTSAGWTLIVLLIAASGVGGIALLRRATRA